MANISRIEVAPLTAAQRGPYDELLDGWLEELTANARAAYLSDLKYFARWLGGGREDIDVAAAMQALFTRTSTQANAVVLAYRKHLLSAPVYSRASRVADGQPDRYGYAPSTINRRLSALRSVAKIARITGVFDGAIEISGVKAPRTKPGVGVGREVYLDMLMEIERRLELYREEPEGRLKHRRIFEATRDRVVIRLLHDIMLRRVEVVRLEVADVDIEGLMLDVRSKGARGRRDDVPLTRRVAVLIEEYLEVRGGEPGALICTSADIGEPLDLSSINLICTRRAIHVGQTAQPHAFRRTAITTGLDMTNGDLRSVASAARHRNPSTTMRYDLKPLQSARNLSDKLGDV